MLVHQRVIIIYSNTFLVNMKDYYDELVDGIGYPIFGETQVLQKVPMAAAGTRTKA